MECQVKKEIEITLKLTQEEFNTLICAYGATNSADRERIANYHNFEILTNGESDAFYTKIRTIAKNI